MSTLNEFIGYVGATAETLEVAPITQIFKKLQGVVRCEAIDDSNST